MELKVQCECGQKFKFEVEPVNGSMPFAVKCPVCGRDGTAAANALIRSNPAALGAPPPAVPAGYSIGRPPAIPAPPLPAPAHAAPQPPPPVMVPAAAIVAAAVRPPKDGATPVNLGLGIAGAFLGAALGGALIYGLFYWGQVRFPLLGVAIGFTTGYGARLAARGANSTLGAVAAVLALLSVVGTLYKIYGEFPALNIISVAVGASAAWRIATR